MNVPYLGEIFSTAEPPSSYGEESHGLDESVLYDLPACRGDVSASEVPVLRQAAWGAPQCGLDSCFFFFLASFCRLASARYFVSVCGLTSMPFSASLAIISGSSKPRFFIRSSAGASASIVCLMLSSYSLTGRMRTGVCPALVGCF